LSKKQELKLVLDTNVWVSALLWGGKPAEIIKLAEQGKVTVFVSEEIVAEISQVLAYPKIKKIWQALGMRREALMEQVLKNSKFVKVTNKVKVICEHPADDRFLECASAANADFVVSGDKHLLKVGAYGKTRILSVNDFLEHLNKKPHG
jgi:uncharacterized protein